MSFSWTGLVLALTYLPLAGYVVQDEVRHSHGGWINLRGFGANLVTAPSQLTLGVLLRRVGVRPVQWARPGARGLVELGVHLLVTAACLYALGAGVEALVRLAV